MAATSSNGIPPRCSPLSISIWMWIVTPAVVAAFDNPRAASSESQFTVRLRMRAANAASRCHFTSPNTG